MVANRLLWRHLVDSLVGVCRLAVAPAQVLGLRLALALVVLATLAVVYPLAGYRLAMVASVVAVVGLAVVGLSLDLLAVLVANRV